MINWLQKFDKASPSKFEGQRQGVYDTYLDRKKEEMEARHKIKLKEFDMFLDNIKVQSTTKKVNLQTPIRGGHESAPGIVGGSFDLQR